MQSLYSLEIFSQLLTDYNKRQIKRQILLDSIGNYICPDLYDVGKFSTTISPHSSGSAENRLNPDFAIETQRRDDKEGCRFGRKKCAHTLEYVSAFF